MQQCSIFIAFTSYSTIILHAAPPKQPQMPAQPNLNPNNRQAQQVYSGDTSYPTYDVGIQEINLRSRRVHSENQPPPPPRKSEEERGGSMPRVNPPPFPEGLTHLVQLAPKENELLGE